MVHKQKFGKIVSNIVKLIFIPYNNVRIYIYILICPPILRLAHQCYYKPGSLDVELKKYEIFRPLTCKVRYVTEAL